MTLHPTPSLEDTLTHIARRIVDGLPAAASMTPAQAAEMLATRLVLIPPRLIEWTASLYTRVRDADAIAQCGRALTRKIEADFVVRTRALAARLDPSVTCGSSLDIGAHELRLVDDACRLAPETDAGLVVLAAIETLERALAPWTGELLARAGQDPDAYLPFAAAYYDGRSFLSAPEAEATARGARFALAEMGDELNFLFTLYRRMTSLEYLRATTLA